MAATRPVQLQQLLLLGLCESARLLLTRGVAFEGRSPVDLPSLCPAIGGVAEAPAQHRSKDGIFAAGREVVTGEQQTHGVAVQARPALRIRAQNHLVKVTRNIGRGI